MVEQAACHDDVPDDVQISEVHEVLRSAKQLFESACTPEDFKSLTPALMSLSTKGTKFHTLFSLMMLSSNHRDLNPDASISLFRYAARLQKRLGLLEDDSPETPATEKTDRRSWEKVSGQPKAVFHMQPSKKPQQSSLALQINQFRSL